jgi:putative membrane protein
MFPGYGCFANFSGYGWIGQLVSLVLVLIAFFGIAWLIRRGFSTNQGTLAETQSNSIEISRVRYARGEITRDQYLEMLDDLKE